MSIKPLTITTPAVPSEFAYSKSFPKHATKGIILDSHVLSFLSPQDIVCARRVCQAWRHLALVNKGCLNLSEMPGASNRVLEQILDEASRARLPITSVDLSNCRHITNVGLVPLLAFTPLTSIKLNNSGVEFRSDVIKILTGKS